MPISNKPETRHHDQSRRFSNGGSKPETAASREIAGSSLLAEGLAQWLRSLPPNPEDPGSIPGLVEG